MKVSVVIRTNNEQKWLGVVLKKLAEQSERDFEIIIVDSGSDDKTLLIVEKFIEANPDVNLKLYKIKPGQFTFPFACNYGAVKSRGDYLIFISGHSVPVNNHWLERGLKQFTDDKIAGVYGNVYALPDASIWEKIFYGFAKTFQGKRHVVKKARMGILGNTNAIIRKKLWEDYHFNEKMIDGGEDIDWAKHFLDRGYIIVKSPDFSVYHSHNLGLIGFIRQFLYWRKLVKSVNKL